MSKKINSFREWLSSVLAHAATSLTTRQSIVFVTQYSPRAEATRQERYLSLYEAMYNLVWLQLFWGAKPEAHGERYLEVRSHGRPIVFVGDPAGIEALASIAKRYRRLVCAKRYADFVNLLKELGLTIPDEQRALILHLWAWADPKERALISIALLEELAPIADIERLVKLGGRALAVAFSATMACSNILFQDISHRLELVDLALVEAEVMAALVEASTELGGRTDFMTSVLRDALRPEAAQSGAVPSTASA